MFSVSRFSFLVSLFFFFDIFFFLFFLSNKKFRLRNVSFSDRNVKEVVKKGEGIMVQKNSKGEKKRRRKKEGTIKIGIVRRARLVVVNILHRSDKGSSRQRVAPSTQFIQFERDRFHILFPGMFYLYGGRLL